MYPMKIWGWVRSRAKGFASSHKLPGQSWDHALRNTPRPPASDRGGSVTVQLLSRDDPPGDSYGHAVIRSGRFMMQWRS